jgi:hypothetical protein
MFKGLLKPVAFKFNGWINRVSTCTTPTSAWRSAITACCSRDLAAMSSALIARTSPMASSLVTLDAAAAAAVSFASARRFFSSAICLVFGFFLHFVSIPFSCVWYVQEREGGGGS